MRTTRIISALVLAAIAFTWLGLPSRVAAQTSYEHTWNFTENSGGWVHYIQHECQGDGGGTGFGYYLSGTGWRSNLGLRCQSMNQSLVIRFDLGDVYDITSISLSWTMTLGNDYYSAGDNRWVWLGYSEDSDPDTSTPIDQEVWPHADPPGPTTTGTLTGASLTSVRYLYFSCVSGINAEYSYPGNQSDPGGSCGLDGAEVTATGGSGGDPFESLSNYKAISEPDLLFIDMENRRATANKPNPNVHSMTSGTIRQIYTFSDSSWGVIVTPVWATSEDDEIFYQGLQSIYGKVGDEVDAGCVLGLAMNTADAGTYIPVGRITLEMPALTQENWPEYSDSPTDIPCDAASQQTPHCINYNPNFANHAEYWHSEGMTQSVSDGILLSPGGKINQQVPLNNALAYTVTIIAGITEPGQAGGDLTVTIGEISSVVHFSASYVDERVLVTTQALSIGDPDYAPDKYTLKIANVPPPGHTVPWIKIYFACIGTEDVQSQPGQCYYDDPGLHTDAWESDPEVTYNAPVFSGASGAYIVPADKMIWRDVDISAFVDSETTFRLDTTTSNGDGAPLTPPYGRWHAYIRDGTTHDLLYDIGEWDTLPVIATIKKMPITLTEGQHLVGEIVIENVSSDISSPGWDQKITRVCLYVEGGIWPGYDSTDTGSIFNENCTVCSQPESLSDVTVENLLSWVVSWLQFGWCYLGYILRCIIAGIINQIWAGVLSIIMGVGLFGVWLGRVVGTLALWAADGARFGFNNLIASLIPIANSILVWLFAQPFFIDVLDGVSLALIWFEAIIQIVLGIFSLFGLAIQFVGALLNLVGTAWSGIIEGLQATSTVTFPFPDCTNPASQFYDACLPIDVSNFIFGEIPALAVLINTAAFAIAWKTTRKAWRKTQESLNS